MDGSGEKGQNDYGGYGGASGKIEIIQTINHAGEVNRFNNTFCRPCLLSVTFFFKYSPVLVTCHKILTSLRRKVHRAMCWFSTRSSDFLEHFQRTCSTSLPFQSKHDSKPNKIGECTPDIRLTGHEKEG